MVSPFPGASRGRVLPHSAPENLFALPRGRRLVKHGGRFRLDAGWARHDGGGPMKVLSRVLNGQQYVANILDQPVSIGTVFRIDDGQAILASHINDFDGGVDLRKYTSTGSKGTLKFSESKDVAISFGGSATTELGESE